MTDQQTHAPPDSDELLRGYERQAREHAHQLVTARIDASMEPTEARESVMRWGLRAAAAVRHGTDEGVRDWIREADRARS